MIKLFRIDERLIHGQIAIKWSRHLNVTHIIVANDFAASNKMMSSSLKMAAPAGIKTAIVTIDKAIELLNDSRSDNLSILLLVDSPKDAILLADKVDEIKKINVGNYGRVAKEKNGVPRKSYSLNIYLDHIEKQEFQTLLDKGLDVYYQTIPEDMVEDFNKIIK